MAVSDVLAQLQQLIQGAAPKLIQVGDQPRDLAQFAPGERYVAKVLEQLNGGRFLVQIRDQVFDLNLPRSTPPGTNIELRFVTAQPRLTFVQADAATSQPASVNLTDGARYLNALLDRVKDLAARQQTQNQAQNPTLQATQLTKPVLEGMPPPTPQFAALLKTNVTQSGLFYESHQAQWALGHRPLAELLREPQGRLSDARAFQAAQLAANPALSGQTPRIDANPANIPQWLAHAVPQSAQEPVHPQSAPLVQQQLDALDQRQIMWQGLIWPGQEMRWEIEEHAARDEEDTTGREWQTRLELQLPNLGDLNAVLTISAQGIRIEVTAQNDDSVSALQAGQASLGASMESAGLRLLGVTVHHHG